MNLLKGKEQSTCTGYQTHRNIEDTCLRCHHHPAIATETISTRKQFPFSSHARHIDGQ